MQGLLPILLYAFAAGVSQSEAGNYSDCKPNGDIYGYNYKELTTGVDVGFSKYRGQVTLVLNVASF